MLKRKKIKASHHSATIQKTHLFCAQGKYDIHYRHDRMDWHTNFMPPPKERDPNECKNFIQKSKG